MTRVDAAPPYEARFRALDALATLTETIAHAGSPPQLYEAALTALADSIGAERAAVLLYDEEGVMRFSAWRALSDGYRARAEGHSPWPRDARDPHMLVVEDVETDEHLQPLLPAFRSEGIRALAFVPLVARGALLGKFMVYWPEPHRASDVELEAMHGIAERVALGIDRLRTEQALRASRDQLEAILHGITDGVTVQDRAGNIVFANPAAAAMIGVAAPEELLATAPGEITGTFEIFDDEGNPFDPRNLPGRLALAGETPSPVMLRFRRRADGIERWAVVSASPVWNAQAQVHLVINIFRDVTASQEATRRERFLAAMTDILAASLDYEKTLASLARLAVPVLADWCRIDLAGAEGHARPIAVEHRDPVLLGRALEIMRRYPLAREQSALSRVCATGKSEIYPIVSGEMLEESPQPPEYIAFMKEIGIRSALIVPLVARGRTIATLTLIGTTRRFTESDLAFAEDVARRAALALDNALLFREEQETRQREQQARAQAEAANRAKDEFLATLSHELRTPLTAILGWSRMLTTMPVDSQMREEGLQAIARSAEAQARIVEDLLDVSRIITGKLQLSAQPVLLDEILDAAITAVRPAAEGKRITVVKRDAGRIVVRGDASRLQQVFWNLLVNSVKFTPRNGIIEVASSAGADGNVEVSVRDSGSGIRPELLPFVFDRFRQGEGGSTRSHGGLGLGLAIVKSLVELHGGSVRAESEGEGKGACFTVTIPTADLAAELPGSTRPRHLTLAGRRILLVEDDVETRTFLATLLESVGAEVRAASDATSALSLFAGWNPDVVVSDIAMPGEDGHALIRRLRTMPGGETVPAVALTAFGRDEDRDQALRSGFTSFLRKPIDPATFIDIVAGETTAGH